MEIIITVDVILVGVDENINPIAEKQNAASIMPIARMNGCVTVTPIAIPTIIGTRDIPIPNSTDASISPARSLKWIRGRLQAFLSSLSVFLWVRSQE